jgi:tRNA dimethylallyltransferase
MALPIVEELLAQGKTPIICGGTGFYINALLYKSQFGNVGANLEIREKYETLYREKGGEYLHSVLQEKDPESAAKLHVNDVKRVIRALEIYETTGKKKSLQDDGYTPRFDFTAVSIDYPRETLYERIHKRVDIMFDDGLLEEVQTLLNSGVSLDAQCMQGIGYKEIVEGLENSVSLDEIKELIKKNTRNYAKRQITFFKRMQNHIRLTPDTATADEVLKYL